MSRTLAGWERVNRDPLKCRECNRETLDICRNGLSRCSHCAYCPQLKQVFARSVHPKFLCTSCAREQSYANTGTKGGITVDEALGIGWRDDEHGWLCPFCAVNKAAEEQFNPFTQSPTTEQIPFALTIYNDGQYIRESDLFLVEELITRGRIDQFILFVNEQDYEIYRRPIPSPEEDAIPLHIRLTKPLLLWPHSIVHCGKFGTGNVTLNGHKVRQLRQYADGRKEQPLAAAPTEQEPQASDGRSR